MRTLILLLASVELLPGYVRSLNNGAFTHRTDNTNIQMYLNTGAVPGLKNASAQTWIAPGSDIGGAVSRAINSWNTVITANVHFASVQPTSSLGGASDLNVIAFDDTAENQQAVGEALAITITRLVAGDATGAIGKTDIIFNPADVFSTDLAAGTYDLQSILTHELGHCLGANHTGVLSAAMFQSAAPSSSSQSVLSQDDISFATDAYPRTNNYGTIAGAITDQSGTLIGGALISAQDAVSGVMAGGLSDPAGGTFSFVLPPGNYRVWAEPLTGLVKAGNLHLITPVDTDFRPVIPEGAVRVDPGVSSHISLTAFRGTSGIEVQFAGAKPPDGSGAFSIFAGPAAVPSGGQVQFVIQASGLGEDVSDTNISVVGPLQVVPGSVSALRNSQYQMTLDVPATSFRAAASLLIDYKGNSAVFSGGLVIQPAEPSFPGNGIGNVFSYSNAAVAPGEIVAIFGANLAPVATAAGSFDAGGDLATSLAAERVTFDGIPAPIFFTSAGQINIEVPYEIAGQASTTVVVTNGNIASAAVTVPVAASMPGLFASALNPDGSINTQTNPLAGTYLVLYATGLGVLPDVKTGKKVVGTASAPGVAATIDERPCAIQYAGAAPGFTGLDQINLVPSGLSSGQHSIAISVNGQPSQSIPVWTK